MMMNRNKRGVAIDLKNSEGKEVLIRMIADADVVIENYRANTMAKLGLGYDDLKVDNPGLIYCAISGFGRTGPYAPRGGYDLDCAGHEWAHEHYRRSARARTGKGRRASH